MESTRARALFHARRMSLEDVCDEFSLVDMCHLYPLVGYDATLAAWNVYQIRDRWCRTERGLNRCGGCHLRDGGLFNNNSSKGSGEFWASARYRTPYSITLSVPTTIFFNF